MDAVDAARFGNIVKKSKDWRLSHFVVTRGIYRAIIVHKKEHQAKVITEEAQFHALANGSQ